MIYIPRRERRRWETADLRRYSICYECGCGWHSTNHARPNWHTSAYAMYIDYERSEDRMTCPECRKQTAYTNVLGPNGFYLNGDMVIGDTANQTRVARRKQK